ncbi:hypothetical protein [Enterobacter hormaechei]|nr:hypothetical protein [Enterobacter hormaechei]
MPTKASPKAFFETSKKLSWCDLYKQSKNNNGDQIEYKSSFLHDTNLNGS